MLVFRFCTLFQDSLLSLTRRAAAFFLLSIAAMGIGQEMPEGRLMRFPDIYMNRIVFSYGGDLWLVSSEGGIAHRITSHPGQELFPKFSPDGKWIAFTAQYDGNYNVYVMPSEGGEPKQLTFHPGGAPLPERYGVHNQVVTWTPDSKRIVFLTHRDSFNIWLARLYEVSLDGGLPRPLPLDKGGLASFSPDGTRIAYNRIFRNFRTWKRYQGGMVQDISIYDLKTHQLEQMPHENWTDTFPMWHGDTIYFDSDRGPEHRLNIYRYSLTTRQIAQLTHFTDFDVNWPSLDSDSMVFENGGFLYKMDLKSEQVRKLTVYLPGDRELAPRHWENVSKLITDFDISPDGNRGVFTARGDVYTVPAKEGSIRNLTRTPGIREKYAAWSPDGRWIAYMSDRTGEDELYLAPQDGSGQELQITFDGNMFRLPPKWAPDSRKLVFADKATRLFYVDVDQKKPVLIDEGKYGELTDYNWSPDSRWVTYAKPAVNLNSEIYLYSLAERRSTPVTTSASKSWAPYFDPEGKYLYFLSNRDFNEVLEGYDPGFSNPKASRVYVVTLRADEASPFPVLSDEATIRTSSKSLLPQGPGNLSHPEEPSRTQELQTKLSPSNREEKPAAEKTKPAEEPGTRPVPQDFRVDLERIQNRIVALPIPPGDLQLLSAAKDLVLYVTSPIQGISGPLPGETSAIHVYDLKEQKDHILIEGADRYALSFDGRKLLYSATDAARPAMGMAGVARSEVSRTYGIIDAKVPENREPMKVGEGALKFENMLMEVDPRAEWKQIFYQVWRLQRDYSYSSINGVNWERQRDKYAQLLPFVADRFSLTYILGELVGELQSSHAYVGGGDYPDLKAANVGLLGADLEADPKSGLYRVARIYPGENWDRNLRSPLTEPGVMVNQGDYLLAVNGRPLHIPQNPYQLLINTANQVVTLTVNSRPAAEGAHDVLVRPLSNEAGLRELDWIETNRRKVDEASGGRIGYVYIPDMSARGLNAFVKQYFPQTQKEGMIIDIRYNLGGFVDEIIFDRLRRTLVAMMAACNWESHTVPLGVFNGYMACVTNHYAASDGDLFSAFFKLYHLGPLIGERTWGGTRGIRGEMSLIDGGFAIAPEFPLYGLDSKWLAENHGVEPDIEVDNQPDLVMQGKDPQLEKAVEVLMEQIREKPKKLPPIPVP
jgi:tricorn protease